MWVLSWRQLLPPTNPVVALHVPVVRYSGHANGGPDLLLVVRSPTRRGGQAWPPPTCCPTLVGSARGHSGHGKRGLPARQVRRLRCTPGRTPGSATPGTGF